MQSFSTPIANRSPPAPAAAAARAADHTQLLNRELFAGQTKPKRGGRARRARPPPDIIHPSIRSLMHLQIIEGDRDINKVRT